MESGGGESPQYRGIWNETSQGCGSAGLELSDDLSHTGTVQQANYHKLDAAGELRMRGKSR